MGMIKLIWSLLSAANKLLRMFQNWNIRKQVRRSYHNEQIAIQLDKSRRANKARRDVRRRTDEQPDKRMQDDGFRRD